MTTNPTPDLGALSPEQRKLYDWLLRAYDQALWDECDDGARQGGGGYDYSDHLSNVRKELLRLAAENRDLRAVVEELAELCNGPGLGHVKHDLKVSELKRRARALRGGGGGG